LFLHWRYRIFWQHRHNRLVLEHVGGRPFLVLPEVFNPTLFWTSEILVGCFSEQLIPSAAAVLDLGTGSGVAAVFAAQWASRVVAVDINPAAVRCAKINAILNQVEYKIDVRQGDLFDPVETERFDVIVFNPPYLPGEPANRMDQAFYATGLAERFAAALSAHLKPQGHALIILSSLGEEKEFLNALQDQGFAYRPIQQKALIGEVLSVYLIAASPALVPASDARGSLGEGI
jgi:release factor glutamine methyltransferase